MREGTSQALWILNRAGFRDWLVVGPDAVGLASERVRVDAVEFERALTAADRAEDLGDKGDKIEQLWDAVALYQGRFLEGFTLRDSQAFDDWQLFESQAMEVLAFRAFSVLTASLMQRRQYDRALEAARLWMARDPYSELAQRRLMRLYSWTGRRPEAIRSYRRFETRLKEIGAVPEDETQELLEDFSRGRIPPEPEQEDGSVRDRPPAARKAPEAQFCPPGPPLIGRTEELRAVTSRLLEPSCRLLVLTGIGGVGKTSLAIHAASQVAGHFEDGWCFVGLQAIHSSEGLTAAVASRLEIALDGVIDPQDQVARCLQHEELLLVLDNFEQLLESTDLLRRWIVSCPGLTLLVTSRLPLQLAGEWLLEVRGLGAPQANSVHSVQNSDAFRLLIDSARQSGTEFSQEAIEQHSPHLARICQVTDGLPLALKLAAAWLGTLSPGEVAEELERNADLAVETRSVSERHRSLKAVFEGTWRLLGSRERGAIERLSIFQRAFTRHAASAVAGVDLPTLMALREKSLVQRIGDRQFEIHPLVRLHSWMRLLVRSRLRAETARRFVRYYARFIERCGVQLKGPSQPRLLERMGRELANIQVAWDRSVRAGDSLAIEKGLEGLYRYYLIRGSFLQAERSLSAAHESLQGKPEHAHCRTRVAIRLARIHILQGKIESAEGLLNRALDCLGARGDSRELSLALSYQGLVAIERGAFDEAEASLREALRVSIAIGDRHAEAGCLLKLGRWAGQTGAHSEGFRLLNQSLRLYQRLRDPSKIGGCHLNIGCLLSTLHRNAEAEEYFLNALRSARRLGHHRNAALALGNLAVLYLRAGEVERADETLLKSRRLAESMGYAAPYARGLLIYGDLYLARGDSERAKRCLRQALELSRGHGYLTVTLDALANLSRILLQSGRSRTAMRLARLAVRHPASEYETRRLAESIVGRRRNQPSRDAATPVDDQALERLVRSVLEDSSLGSSQCVIS